MTALPTTTDRAAFEAEIERLRVREKAHTRAGDAIAAARRRLPMVEVDATTPLEGPDGPVTLLDAFEGRSKLVLYFFMWYPGNPAKDQCEGCTWYTTQVAEMGNLNSHDITYAVACQGPYDESRRYRDFMGWTMPWYSIRRGLLLADRPENLMYLICYVRDGDRVFETYWTTRRGVEAMDYSYALMDLTVHGRQEDWEDSPDGWPRGGDLRTDGRPIPQWARIAAGRNDTLREDTDNGHDPAADGVQHSAGGCCH